MLNRPPARGPRQYLLRHTVNDNLLDEPRSFGKTPRKSLQGYRAQDYVVIHRVQNDVRLRSSERSSGTGSRRTVVHAVNSLFHARSAPV
jgi:hypothetical protein